MSDNSIEVIDRGLRCLSDHLGARETELFISTLLRERFDYTRWRTTFVDRIGTFEELDHFLEETGCSAIFGGNPDVVL